jgi:CBS domain-containing protein
MKLIDGRRVTVGDLVDADLLKGGDSLRFNRRRVGASFQAEVTFDGRIRLPDGQEFRTPSGAAMMAAGMRAVDGWHAWIVESAGVPLDALRQEFINRAVECPPESAAAQDDAVSPLRVHEKLRDARTRADGDDPVRITVRDLLSLWGAKGRGDQVSRIEADLANHGLVTRPSFRKVTLEADVVLITAAREVEDSVKDTVEVTVMPSDDTDATEEPSIGLTVGNLDSALNGITSVSPTASIDEAITKMLLNDFSQLAVLAGPHTLRGAVTWRSITQAQHRDPQARLTDAIVPARDFPYDKELIEILPDLQRDGFAFVRNERNAVAGIVTNADVVAAYGEMANPFFLIGELDRSLRRLIARNLELEDVNALCERSGGRAMRSFDDMSMGDYQRVLENQQIWDKLGWSLHRAVFVERLGEIRKVRNDVMHFNPDPLPTGTVEKLRYINTLLRTYAG